MATPPNIILILSSAHRWDVMGCMGNSDVRTPNMDALAAYGVTFTNAVCQIPDAKQSRTSMLSGQYPPQLSLRALGQGPVESSYNLPTALGAAGYHTAALGRMVLSPTRANIGFDVMHLAEIEAERRKEDDYHAWLRENHMADHLEAWDSAIKGDPSAGPWQTLGAVASSVPSENHATTWTGNRAVRFLQSASEPFFLMVSFTKPHPPFDVLHPWSRMYDPDEVTLAHDMSLSDGVPSTDENTGDGWPALTSKRLQKVLAHYYGSLSHVDLQIGRILGTLRGRGYTNNVIVYTADHGAYLGHKGLLFETEAPPFDPLIRVPLIISGAGGQRRGARETAPAELTDIMPTLLEATGVAIRDSVQGISLLPLLRDGRRSLRTAAYVEYIHGTKIARNGHYKLIESSTGAYDAFYDLGADPWEQENILGNPKTIKHQVALAKTLRRTR